VEVASSQQLSRLQALALLTANDNYKPAAVELIEISDAALHGFQTAAFVKLDGNRLISQRPTASWPLDEKHRAPRRADGTLCVVEVSHCGLEVAQGIQAGEDAFNEAVAKIVATRHLAAEKTERADHLSELKKVIEATDDLRAKSGKLSADKVASVFGLSVAELAALVGRTRQTASKTPDADSLQTLLQPFERVARVRTVLNQNDFRKWLRLANDELDGRTPFEMIREGKVAVVADLVEDMLTGSPS
jgi:cell division protein ZapA (FtsZ GTPase activity inhibitor)